MARHSSTPQRDADAEIERAFRDTESNGLTEVLNRQLRPLLDAAEALNKDPRWSERFPKIVVVGDQSDGKSTVMEAISRVRFPRGTGLCTRCPIQLSLRRGDESKIYVSYKINDREYKKTGDIGDFERMILESQTELTQGLDFPISQDVIEVLVQSPDSFDLTLVDLPGINRKDESCQAKTVQIVEKYIENSQTIIIVVFKATTDIEAVQGFQLAKKVDKNGERTFGVMTFCDSLTDSVEQSVANLLGGMPPPGIVVKDIFPVSCYHANENGFGYEREVLMKRKVFRELLPEKFGTLALVTRLSQEVLQRLRPWTDQIVGLVKKKHSEQHQQLKELLCDQPTQADSAYTKSCELVQELSQDFIEHITGSHRHQKNETYAACSRLFAKFKDSVQTITENMEKKLITIILSEYTDQRGREFPIATNIFPIIERITAQLTDEYQWPTDEMFVAVCITVETSLENITSRVLHKFPQLKEFLLSELLKLFRSCQDTTDERLKELAQMETIVFSMNPAFAAKLNWDSQMGSREFVQDTLERQQSSSDSAVDGGSSVLDWDQKRLYYLTKSYLRIVQDRVIDSTCMTVLKYLNHGLVGKMKSAHSLLPERHRIHDMMQDPAREEKIRRVRIELEKWRVQEENLARLG